MDAKLFRAAIQLEQSETRIQLGTRYQLGPSGQAIRSSFEPVGESRKNFDSNDDINDGNEAYRVFWGRSKDLRTTMEAQPEQAVTDKNAGLADRYRHQADHLLLAAKFDTISGRLLAIFSEVPALGSMWVPVQAQTASTDYAKAICA